MIITMIIGQVDGGGTPTSTPMPDIFEYPEAPPDNDMLQLVNNLMQVDEDCLLPCFWGFNLDEHTTEETTEFVIDYFQQIPYISLSIEKDDPNYLLDPSTRGMDFYESFLPLSGGHLQVIFRSIDDVLVRTDIQLFMAVNWLENNPYVLSELLSQYGEPTNVYMRYSPTPKTAYLVAVVYEERGFMVKYRFGSNVSANERLVNERFTEKGRLLICVEDHTYDSIALILQKDGSPIPLVEALLPPLDNPSVIQPFWDIEDMTGLSVKEFAEAFADNSDACIEAYSLSELRELGYE